MDVATECIKRYLPWWVTPASFMEQLDTTIVSTAVLSMAHGLLMMPTALAAMGMKLASKRVLKRYGYRLVSVIHTMCMGITIALFAVVDTATPLAMIIGLGLAQGLFNSLQFSSMNSMANADVQSRETSMATTIASSLRQMSMSFGLACATLLVAAYLGHTVQTDAAALRSALHHAFLTMGALTIASSLSFWALRRADGESVSRGESDLLKHVLVRHADA